jgi:glutamate N-acetyltransferase/amino-acid N-acetyltransferase
MAISLPQGFRAHVTNVGIKDTTDDFTLVVADTVCAAAGMFTQSRFAGPSVVVSREHIASHKARAVVVISKNANVATGELGMSNAREVVAGVSSALGCDPHEVLIASTGVIGRQYPMDKVRAGLASLPAQPQGTSADDVARGIMTTDTVSKVAECVVAGSSARVVGVAKGVGMIEPNMATLITMMFTDAQVSPDELNSVFQSVIAQTFNCVSVDGEGAEKLIEVHVDSARDYEQAKTIAKAIVNSPLVKTAVHGADPNWGRVAMAIGKCSQYNDVNQEQVVIRFGAQEVYPTQVNDQGLSELSAYMKGADVRIHVSLKTGSTEATVWGCDLTDGYVRINADYTT